jgi:hypothetical protein
MSVRTCQRTYALVEAFPVIFRVRVIGSVEQALRSDLMRGGLNIETGFDYKEFFKITKIILGQLKLKERAASPVNDITALLA